VRKLGWVVGVIAGAALVAVAIPAAQMRAKIAALESNDDRRVLAALAGLEPASADRPIVRERVARLFQNRSAAVQAAAADFGRSAGSHELAAAALEAATFQRINEGSEQAVGQLIAELATPGEIAIAYSDALYRPVPDASLRSIEIACLRAGPEADAPLARVALAWCVRNLTATPSPTLLEIVRKRSASYQPLEMGFLLEHSGRPELLSALLESIHSKADPATLERLSSLASSRAYSADEESLRERAALAFARAGDAAQVTSLALHSSAGASRLAGATRRAEKTDPALEPLARGGLDALFELCSSKVPGRGDAVAATSLILRGAAGRLEPPERARVLPADARSKTLAAVIEWTRVAPDNYWTDAARALGPAVRVLDEDLTASTKLVDDPQPRLRFLGLDALVRGKGKEAAPFLDRLSRDPVQAIRLQAAIRDAWVGRQEAIPRLIELTSDLDREVAEQARLNLELLLGDIESGPGLTERARTLWEQKKTRLVIQPIYPEKPGAPGSALVPR
jgi:hypothetical protein